MARFLTSLTSTKIAEAGPEGRPLFRLHEALLYETDATFAGHRLPVIVVPEGFETDMASVPRMIFTWGIAGGVGDEAAVVHDWLYRRGAYTRAACDAIFLEALQVLGVARWRRRLMYRAVRLFGARAWLGREADLA